MEEPTDRIVESRSGTDDASTKIFKACSAAHFCVAEYTTVSAALGIELLDLSCLHGIGLYDFRNIALKTTKQ